MKSASRLASDDRIRPGASVYVRWGGAEIFEIVEKANVNSSFPHWVCRCIRKKDYEYFVVPQLQISTKCIKRLAGDNNRNKLSIFDRKNGNVSFSQGS